MDTSAEKRKPGRPRKSPQTPLQNPVVKRLRGRPPRNATAPPATGSGVAVEPGKRKRGRPEGTPPVTGSGVVVEPGKRKRGRPERTPPVAGYGVVVDTGKRKRGRPKLNSISMVNDVRTKRGRPKKLTLVTRSTGRGRPNSTKPVAQYVSVNGGGGGGDAVSHRGRPPKSKVNHVDGHSLLSTGRGRPTKNKANMNFLALLNSLGGIGTAALVIDPMQLVAYKELKLKYEHLESKAKEVVAGVSAYVNPGDEVFRSLQELESLVGTDVNVQS